MSRSGYVDDLDEWAMIRWRGAVASAIRGKRGQALLREMLAALDALPEKRLIENALVQDGEVCAFGAVARARGIGEIDYDPDDDDPDIIAHLFGVSRALACEIMYENDEGGWRETPEARFARIRRWIVHNLAALDKSLQGKGEG